MVIDMWKKYTGKDELGVSILIPVTKVVDWFKKRRKKQAETVWAYECGCDPKEGYQSPPYCVVHGTKLYLREVV